MTTRIKSGSKILFIGDSITDCGRRAAAAPLGSGYVKLFADMLAIREPEKSIAIINKGIGGDNVPGLMNRWQDDVLWHRPDWLSIKIGINDLHQRLRNPESPTSASDYEKGYTAIIERTKKALPKCQILLIDPFYISRDTASDTFRRKVLDVLPDYIRVVHKLCAKYKTRLVRTHDMFQRLLKYYEADAFCGEPVHPNSTGHLAIVEEVWRALSK
jgi:acyl-CoA thioesterase I